MTSLTPSQLDLVNSTFDTFDKDKSGTISTTELSRIMRRIGQSPTESELASIIAEVDTDKSGNVSRAEFVKMMEKSFAKGDADLEVAFKAYDKDGSGYLTVEEVRKVASALLHDKRGFGKQDVEQLLKQVDANGDGKIQFAEFVKLANQK
ncbi:calmodulin-like 3 [Quaeritorhiza haematococci]|nr:calmodulin-like 3 [Quaeritorhiza haematococci]